LVRIAAICTFEASTPFRLASAGNMRAVAEPAGAPSWRPSRSFSLRMGPSARAMMA
jgi:hypothetical protein